MQTETQMWRRAVVLLAAAAIAACTGKTKPQATATTLEKGVAGLYYFVNLSKPLGGRVTSTDGRIDCGLGATACGDALGQTRYDWSETVELQATADVANGYTFLGWAGDCKGPGTCTLYAGADRTVAAVFQSPLPPAGDGGVYGVTFVVRVSKPQGGTVNSTDGQIACGSAGGSCRGVWPWTATATLVATPDAGLAFGTWAGDCNLGGACNLTTASSGADKTVAAVFGPVGLVQHGRFTSPSIHGRAFFDFAAGVPSAFRCTSCHGTNYQGLGIAPSCNACHATAGWTMPWQSNCSFCHGAKNADTQRGYAFADQPAWAAPPDDIAGRLTGTNSASRTGGHQAHMTGVTAAGASFTQPFQCGTCHAVPTDLSHISGANERATVTLTGTGQALLPADLGTYDQGTGNCTTYCHGPATVNWATSVVACGSCHGVPPPESTGHPAATLAQCIGCHPGTMNPDVPGTINIAGGKHIDGIVEAEGHGDYTSPTVHGPKFFGAVAVNPASPSCTACHGVDYGGMGNPAKNCNACHVSAGWALPWQSNCSFCHGAKNTDTQPGYSFAANPTWSAPPADIQGRLTGTNDPSRTGAHQAHMKGVAASGESYAVPFTCATCHAVPTDLSHISGQAARAAVNLQGAGQASLPASLGTYSATPGTCSTYCHGSGMVGGTLPNPAWSATVTRCDACHGVAPDTGVQIYNADYEVWMSAHVFHTTDGIGYACVSCHSKTSNFVIQGGKVVNVLLSDKTFHVNGVNDLSFQAGGTWNSVAGTCAVACHGNATRTWRP